MHHDHSLNTDLKSPYEGFLMHHPLFIGDVPYYEQTKTFSYLYEKKWRWDVLALGPLIFEYSRQWPVANTKNNIDVMNSFIWRLHLPMKSI